MKKYISIGVLLSALICNQGLSQQGFKETSHGSINVKSLEERVNIKVNTIKIASFNIQIFGKSKRENKNVIRVLSEIVQNFDIIAIQEIRDKTKTTLPYFIKRINSSEKDKYDFIESKRLGRSVSKESYGFVYNTERVSYADSYVYDDKNDMFEREPFIAGFKSGKFDYILVNIHVKPSDAENEITNLIEVVEDADSHFPDDKDVIVLGDFNADGSYFSENNTAGFRDKKYFWAVDDGMDTTVGKNLNTYDRIVFTENTKEDYTGLRSVFRFDVEYNLSFDFAKKVSDHYPVWVMFWTDRDSD